MGDFLIDPSLIDKIREKNKFFVCNECGNVYEKELPKDKCHDGVFGIYNQHPDRWHKFSEYEAIVFGAGEVELMRGRIGIAFPSEMFPNGIQVSGTAYHNSEEKFF